MNTIDLTYCVGSSELVPARTQEQVFMNLVEEVGEVATCINRPEKAGEPLIGELADVINCVLDLYWLEHGSDLRPLEKQIELKCAKWRAGKGV